MLPPTNSTRISQGRNGVGSSLLRPGCEANARNTSVSRKKWAIGALISCPSGSSSTIQKNEQMSSEMNPRTVPIGSPNGWKSGGRTAALMALLRGGGFCIKQFEGESKTFPPGRGLTARPEGVALQSSGLSGPARPLPPPSATRTAVTGRDYVHVHGQPGDG